MKKLEQWYKNMNKSQKVFVYLLSVALIILVIGAIFLALLIYLELGERG
jgi:cell division protein FtsL